MKLPAVVTEGFLQSLPEHERKKLGKAGITAKEALQTYQRGQERDLQKQVASYLDLNQIYYDNDRMDQRTSGKRGRADFRICCVKATWVSAECKAESCTLESAQALEAARLRKSGGRFVLVFRLMDLIDEFRNIDADDA
jgi:hypothetical protein